MPYRNMTLDELARHIGMDARLVKRWAERGRLPGLMVHGKWRFNRARMLDWLQHEIPALDREHITNLERAMSDGREGIILSELLTVDGIDMNLPARSRPPRPRGAEVDAWPSVGQRGPRCSSRSERQ